MAKKKPSKPLKKKKTATPKKSAVKKKKKTATTTKKAPKPEKVVPVEKPTAVETFKTFSEMVGVPTDPDDVIGVLVRILTTIRGTAGELQDIRPFLGALGFDLKTEKEIVSATTALQASLEHLSEATSRYFCIKADVDASPGCDEGI